MKCTMQSPVEYIFLTHHSVPGLADITTMSHVAWGGYVSRCTTPYPVVPIKHQSLSFGVSVPWRWHTTAELNTSTHLILKVNANKLCSTNKHQYLSFGLCCGVDMQLLNRIPAPIWLLNWMLVPIWLLNWIAVNSGWVSGIDMSPYLTAKLHLSLLIAKLNLSLFNCLNWILSVLNCQIETSLSI
jgi:hypothetical protein